MKLGCAKQEVTYFKPGIGMFGYGRYEHRAIAVETPLLARAFIIENDQTLLGIVCVEILSCTIALKQAVLDELKAYFGTELFTHENLTISGNHTHSAPAGHTHYPFYTFSTGGFCPGVLRAYTQGIVKAIIQAYETRVSGSLSFQEGSFEPHIPVAFNRSIHAYNRNPDVIKLEANQEHLAVNRTVSHLIFKNQSGELLGLINWFGVHTTCVGNDEFKICADSKGYASTQFEADYPQAIIAFAQEACGDVSPNYTHPNVPYKNNFENQANGFERAKENAQYQYEKAQEILKNNPKIALEDYLDAHHFFANIPHTQIAEAYAYQGQKTVSTSAIGVPVLKGTHDGWGVVGALAVILEKITTLVNVGLKIRAKLSNSSRARYLKKLFETQGVKNIVFDTHAGTVLGTNRLERIPKYLDRMVDVMRVQHQSGSLSGYPLVPETVPLQLFKIGSLLLVSLPGEITVTASERLKKSLKNNLPEIKHIVVMPYSNAYCGYITTPEEYQEQCYEGGHTLFGPLTLAAYQTQFDILTKALEVPQNKRITCVQIPVKFPKDLLDKRTNFEYA